MKTLLLTDPMPAGYFTPAIHAIEPGAELIEYRPDMTDAELATIDVVLGWRFPAGVAARLPNLQWVCSVAAGVEKLLVPELAPGVVVSRIVDAEQAEGIAQFVVLMALRHARGLVAYEALQRSHDWRRQPVAAVRSRVAVLGMGHDGWRGGTLAERGRLRCDRLEPPHRWAARRATGHQRCGGLRAALDG